MTSIVLPGVGGYRASRGSPRSVGREWRRMTPDVWSRRLTNDVLHLMQSEVQAGLARSSPQGIRVAEFLVEIRAAAEPSRMRVTITKAGTPDTSYEAALDENPITIAYAVATRLGFVTDALKRNAQS